MDTKDPNADTPQYPSLEPTELAEVSSPEVTTTTKVRDVQQASTPFRESLRRFRRDIRAMISLGSIVFLFLAALIGPVINQHIGGECLNDQRQVVTPETYHSFSTGILRNKNLGIGERNTKAFGDQACGYLLGTDQLGRDLLARMLQGLTISLFVALSVGFVNLALGILVGVLAGYYRSWIDQVLARFTDLMFAFPGLLFAILLSGIFGNGPVEQFLSNIPFFGANGNARLILVSLALSLTSWPLMARYVRGQTLQIREQQYIEAARTSGATNSQIITKHIVPNLFSIVIVATTLNLSNTIIGEAGISLLGLGVKTPGSSLGLMISDALQDIDSHPWQVMFPTLVLTIIVLAFSFIGDGLNDAFDARAKD